MQSTESTVTLRAAVHGLAIVGFIALISAGIWLAIYSARFVPGAVNRLSIATVFLSQIFVPKPAPILTVVESTPIEVISFSDKTVTSTNATSTVSMVKKTPLVPARPGWSMTVPMGSTTPTQALFFGLPDLIVTIDRVGYVTSTSTDPLVMDASFVATTTIPNGNIPAVRFTVKNSGTNVAGPWRFSASIPTLSQNIYNSTQLNPIYPGPAESLSYILRFTEAIRGTDKMISVTANFDHAITESNYENNSASANVTILGN